MTVAAPDIGVVLAAQGHGIDWRLALSVAAFALSGAALGLPYWRRPSLSLHPDSERTHSRIEGDRVPYLRLPVRNKKHKRAARHPRVVLDGYRPTGLKGPLIRLGSPFLGWPSVLGQGSDAYVEVIFSGAERPVGLGRFARVKLNENERRVRPTQYRQDLSPAPIPVEGRPGVLSEPDDPEAEWHLHLELADSYELTDERDWLPPGRWTVHLVGADDGDAHAYELDVAWKGNEGGPAGILAAALDSLKLRRQR